MFPLTFVKLSLDEFVRVPYDHTPYFRFEEFQKVRMKFSPDCV